MGELSMREMRAGYHVITDALERDGEVVLTHHGKPFAKVVPILPQVEDAKAQAAARREKLLAWGKERRKAPSKMKELPPFDWDEFRKDRV